MPLNSVGETARDASSLRSCNSSNDGEGCPEDPVLAGTLRSDGEQREDKHSGRSSLEDKKTNNTNRRKIRLKSRGERCQQRATHEDELWHELSQLRGGIDGDVQQLIQQKTLGGNSIGRAKSKYFGRKLQGDEKKSSNSEKYEHFVRELNALSTASYLNEINRQGINLVDTDITTEKVGHFDGGNRKSEAIGIVSRIESVGANQNEKNSGITRSNGCSQGPEVAAPSFIEDNNNDNNNNNNESDITTNLLPKATLRITRNNSSGSTTCSKKSAESKVTECHQGKNNDKKTEDSNQKQREGLSDFDSCFICGSNLASLSLEERSRHVNMCLDTSANERLLKSLSSSSKLRNSPDDRSDIVKCVICGKDLSYLSTTKQQYHINRCCDNQEKNKKKNQTPGTYTCIICQKPLDMKSKIKHLKLCAKLHNITPVEIKQILDSHRRNQESDVDSSKSTLTAAAKKRTKTRGTASFKRKRDDGHPESGTKSEEDASSSKHSFFDDFKFDVSLRGVNTSNTSPPLNVETVQEWLTSISLQEYVSNFVDSGFDTLEICTDLTEGDLNENIGIKKPGHRKRLLMASKQLKKSILIRNNIRNKQIARSKQMSTSSHLPSTHINPKTSEIPILPSSNSCSQDLDNMYSIQSRSDCGNLDSRGNKDYDEPRTPSPLPSSQSRGSHQIINKKTSEQIAQEFLKHMTDIPSQHSQPNTPPMRTSVFATTSSSKSSNLWKMSSSSQIPTLNVLSPFKVGTASDRQSTHDGKQPTVIEAGTIETKEEGHTKHPKSNSPDFKQTTPIDHSMVITNDTEGVNSQLDDQDLQSQESAVKQILGENEEEDDDVSIITSIDLEERGSPQQQPSPNNRRYEYQFMEEESITQKSSSDIMYNIEENVDILRISNEFVKKSEEVETKFKFKVLELYEQLKRDLQDLKQQFFLSIQKEVARHAEEDYDLQIDQMLNERYFLQHISDMLSRDHITKLSAEYHLMKHDGETGQKNSSTTPEIVETSDIGIQFPSQERGSNTALSTLQHPHPSWEKTRKGKESLSQDFCQREEFHSADSFAYLTQSSGEEDEERNNLLTHKRLNDSPMDTYHLLSTQVSQRQLCSSPELFHFDASRSEEDSEPLVTSQNSRSSQEPKKKKQRRYGKQNEEEVPRKNKKTVASSRKQCSQDKERNKQKNEATRSEKEPKFEEMCAEELKERMSSFGLKSGSQKYMIEKLRQIWRAQNHCQ